MSTSRRDFLKRAGVFGSFVIFKPVIFNLKPDSLPNVLIIGDSISIGYTPFVKELLAGKAIVSRPDENCSGTTKGVSSIDKWLGSVPWDLIHFNFGLHDLKHVDPNTGGSSTSLSDPYQADVRQYTKNLKFIISRMKTTGAKLIFATTTPVPENSGSPLREPGSEINYNKAALKLAKKHNIIVNDLYTYSLPIIKEIQRPNNVHFTEKGSMKLAEKVAESILQAL